MKRSKALPWDKLVTELTYSEVADLSRSIPNEVPSMYSPDGKLIYLKSMDAQFDVADTKTLRSIFPRLFADLEFRLRCPKYGALKQAYWAENDYVEVFRILYAQDALPEGYTCPERYLERLYRRIIQDEPLDKNEED